MMNGIWKFLSSVAEFIGRFWPLSEDQDRLLGDLGAVYDGNGTPGDGSVGDES